MDATTQRLLAFLHPAWMIASLVLAGGTARLGIEIRRRRRAGRAVGPGLRRRHLRLGRATLWLVVVGFLLGPCSMALFRGRELFASFHGILGLIVTGLFLWTGHSGRALAHGDRSARSLHRALAAASLAAALLAAVAGFTLLP